MIRAKRVFTNSYLGIIYYTINAISGFIIPYFILTYFGSRYNGLIAAITHFLAFAVLLQVGMPGIMQSALFNPLAEKNVKQVSSIVNTAKHFYLKVTLLYFMLVIIFTIIFPITFNEDIDKWFVASLVITISVTSFSQHLMSAVYLNLLSADQRVGMISVVSSIKVLSATLVTIIMIYNGFGIISIKIATGFLFVSAAYYIIFYAKRHYVIDRNIPKNDSFMKQRWDNFAQEVAAFVSTSMPFIVMSIFSSVYEISVFAVYNFIFIGVSGLFYSLTRSIPVVFGNMLAKSEHELVKNGLKIYEQIVFIFTTFFMGVTVVSAVPFAQIFTANVIDADYSRPFFVILFTVVWMFRFFMTPYAGIVFAGGHFRQTRNPAIIEIIINVVITVVLIHGFGIIGIALGGLISSTYRCICYAVYVSRHMVKRKILYFIKRVFISLMIVFITFVFFTLLPLPVAQNYLHWAINSSIVSIFILMIIILFEITFYQSDLKVLLRMIKHSLT